MTRISAPRPRLPRKISRGLILAGQPGRDRKVRDFAAELGRAARLDFGDTDKPDSAVTYAPDLNRCVVLNIAPLHELVPWKEAKAYWDELLKGEYEWSSMGKQLRKKRTVNAEDP
jgi:hypothetical protein